MRLRALLLAVMAAALFGAPSAHAQQPVKIRIAWVVPVANSPTILYEIPSILQHKGKSYEIELIRFQGTPPMITALATNEVDIALLAYSSLALAIQNANLADLRVIADEAQEGVDGYYTSPFMVLKDGPVNKVEDMKGKVAATVGPGAAVDIAMRAMLKKHGLDDKRDYTVVEGAFPNMRALLADKKADLITAVLPFSINPELVAIGRPLFTVKDAIGRSEFIIWAARDGFLQKNKAAMTDFMEELGARSALSDGPEESRPAPGDRRPREQTAGGGVRELDVYQQGSLPRSQHDSGHRRTAAEHRCPAGPRLPESQARYQTLCRFELREGRGAADQIISACNLGGAAGARRSRDALGHRFQNQCPLLMNARYELYARAAINSRYG